VILEFKRKAWAGNVNLEFIGMGMAFKAMGLLGTVAHACDPHYSGGRDQEDGSSKPAQANSSPDPIWKNPSQKGLPEWLKVKALSSSPTSANKIKQNKAMGLGDITNADREEKPAKGTWKRGWSGKGQGRWKHLILQKVREENTVRRKNNEKCSLYLAAPGHW
jgi:hypothetical protein